MRIKVRFFAGALLALAGCTLSSGAGLAAWHPILRGPASDNATAYQLNVAHTGGINLSTGFTAPLKQAWSQVVSTSFAGPGFSVIADGLVFVSAITNDVSTTYALDQADGHTVWSKTFHAPPPPLAYDNGNLFVQTLGGSVSSFKSTTGDQNWSIQLPFANRAASYPIAVNGMFYTGGGNDDGDNIYALNQSDGSLAWGLTGFEDDTGSPTYGDKGLYVAYSCQYFKLNPKRPKVDWFDDLQCLGGGGIVPASFDKRVYVPDPDRSNVVLDSKSGAVVDSFANGETPTLFTDSRGKAYGVTRNLSLVTCWRLSTGTTAWTFSGDGKLSTLPIAVNGLVVVGSESGMLYVLDGKKGKVKWSTNTKLVLSTLTAGQGMLVVGGGNTVIAFVPK